MMRIAAVSVFVALGGLTVLGQGPVDGELSGRVTDAVGGPVPGALVEVAGGDERREALTDADGRFVFSSLSLTDHHVVVELPGFVPREGTISLSPSSRRARLEWSIEVGCFSAPPLRIVPEVKESARGVDAIVHVRVESDDGLIVWSTRPDCEGEVLREYDALVLSAVPGRGENIQRLRILVRDSRANRLMSGPEYLALLRRKSESTYFSADHILPIVAGRVESPEAEELNGMPVHEALDLLTMWSQEGRR
jgi:hypothetical protein